MRAVFVDGPARGRTWELQLSPGDTPPRHISTFVLEGGSFAKLSEASPAGPSMKVLDYRLAQVDAMNDTAYYSLKEAGHGSREGEAHPGGAGPEPGAGHPGGRAEGARPLEVAARAGVTGWRFWRLRQDGALWSISSDVRWDGPRLSAGPPHTSAEATLCARTHRRDHVVHKRFWGTRFWQCGRCGALLSDAPYPALYDISGSGAVYEQAHPFDGVHAFASRRKAEDGRAFHEGWCKSSPSLAGNVESWAAGEVALWGRVIEHAEGWRAEHALVTSLWGVPPWLARRVEDLYQCDAFPDFGSWAAAYNNGRET